MIPVKIGRCLLVRPFPDYNDYVIDLMDLFVIMVQWKLISSGTIIMYVA